MLATIQLLRDSILFICTIKNLNQIRMVDDHNYLKSSINK